MGTEDRTEEFPAKPSGSRKIIHIDMDAFCASVEQRDNPELRGKPVAVGQLFEACCTLEVPYQTSVDVPIWVTRRWSCRLCWMREPSVKSANPDQELAMYTVAFFDIGKTLGIVTEHPLRLEPFASTQSLLQSFGAALGLRLGIITNSGDYSTADIRAMLEAAGLLRLFEPALVITSAEVGAEKPKAKIYICAAARAAVSIGQCLYIGEAPIEVDAAQSAGMGGLLKPVP